MLVTGVFWGVYWAPVRVIADLGLDSAWGTGAITLAAMLFLLPFVAGKTHVFRDTGFVGALTAAIFAGETPPASEMIGGGLVIFCGLLEVWPTKVGAGQSHPAKTGSPPG